MGVVGGAVVDFSHPGESNPALYFIGLFDGTGVEFSKGGGTAGGGAMGVKARLKGGVAGDAH